VNGGSDERTGKDGLRRSIRQRRRQRPEADRLAARRAIAGHVLARIEAWPLPAGTVVAGYEPLPSEPGSPELLAGLAGHGLQVLLPITRADRDLDWHLLGNPEPAGLEAISRARLILVPAFAVDRAGRRLGRGGGSYDRALTRVSAAAHVAALLYDDELVDRVPTEPWDRAVHSAVTPSGWYDLTALR